MGIKFPAPWKTLIIKFPPPQDGRGVKWPGYARGGGGHVEAWIWPIHYERMSLNWQMLTSYFNNVHVSLNFILGTFLASDFLNSYCIFKHFQKRGSKLISLIHTVYLSTFKKGPLKNISPGAYFRNFTVPYKYICTLCYFDWNVDCACKFKLR